LSLRYIVNQRSQALSSTFSNIRPWWQEITISILLLSPGYWFGNEIISICLPLFLIIIYRANIKNLIFGFPLSFDKRDLTRYIILPGVFLFLALLNKIFNGIRFTQLSDLYASFYFLPFLLFTSFFVFSERASRVLIFLICLEIFVACFEYYAGVRSFFLVHGENVVIDTRFSFYTTRIFGFGGNSSIFAQRCLIGFFLVQSLRISVKLRAIIYFILSVGILLSFNRTVIMALFVFLVLYLIQLLWRRFYLKLHEVNAHLIPWFCLILFWFLMCFSSYFRVSISREGEEAHVTQNKTPDDFESHQCFEDEETALSSLRTTSFMKPIPRDEQDSSQFFVRLFSSELNGVRLSGRENIWLNYLLFIENHKLFGNGSDKLMLKRCNSETGQWQYVHAHCSYLMLFATHGIILGVIFLVMYLVWWNFKNLPFILTVLIYSLMQYGVFWAFSLMDVVLLSAIVMTTNNDENGGKEHY
jgi:hypothetical protein